MLRLRGTLDELVTKSGLSMSLKVCIAEQKRLSNWAAFSRLLTSDASQTNGHHVDVPTHDPEHIALIIFTSGTTSLPKACPHTHRSINANLHGRIERSNIDSTGVYCSVMPNNHMNGCLAPLAYLSMGGTVVYPDQVFKAASMLAALEEERCSNTTCVPTILHALLDRMSERGHKFDCLRQVDLGGATVSPKHLKQCVYSLGAKKVGTSFGMTEGSPLRATPASDPNELVRGDSVIAGKPLRGAKVRICAPGSSMPLPRGQYGELHQGGPQVIKSYLGEGKNDDFYRDAMGNTWFRTGDQAVMHDDCSVSIVGRYKDMIIRGGENISPLSIERVLNMIDGVDVRLNEDRGVKAIR
jgi:acyl-CoA synthetase (AMP-forming)/AMP-acid ligase II